MVNNAPFNSDDNAWSESEKVEVLGIDRCRSDMPTLLMSDRSCLRTQLGLDIESDSQDVQSVSSSDSTVASSDGQWSLPSGLDNDTSSEGCKAVGNTSSEELSCWPKDTEA